MTRSPVYVSVTVTSASPAATAVRVAPTSAVVTMPAALEVARTVPLPPATGSGTTLPSGTTKRCGVRRSPAPARTSTSASIVAPRVASVRRTTSRPSVLPAT